MGAKRQPCYYQIRAINDCVIMRLQCASFISRIFYPLDIFLQKYLVRSISKYLACLDGAKVITSGLKSRRSPVQVLPKNNFSITISYQINQSGSEAVSDFTSKQSTCGVSNTVYLKFYLL